MAMFAISTINRFNFEAEPWSASGLLRATKTSLCATKYVLGGPNAFNQGGYFSTEFNDLPSHNIIYFSIRFILTGTWSSNDAIKLLFDTKAVRVENIDLLSSIFASKTCDGTAMNTLYLYTITGKVFHTDSSLTLKIMSDLITSPTSASFGTRAIFLLFANKSASDAETYCFRNDEAVITQALPNKCSCITGRYQNPLNAAQCLVCHTSCYDCFGPSSSECYRCATGYSFVNSQCILCDTSCDQCFGTASNQCTSCVSPLWLYWDGTCKSSCTSPTTSQLVYDNLRICNLPCPEGQFMLYNGTCVNFCDGPLIVVDNSTGIFCNKRCADGEFWYANGSCIAGTCDLPFEAGAVLGADVCLWKCEEGKYMRWDWTCQDSCDFPLEKTVNSTGKFCWKPCGDGELWYANESCIAGTCESPFVASMTLDVDVCLFKCDADEFLYENDETCVDSCKFPFLQREGEGAEGKYCYSPCESVEYIFANRSCDVNCSFHSEKIDNFTKVCIEPEVEDYEEIKTIAKVIKIEGQISYGLMMALGFGKMGSSNSLCLASLAKMLEYIKYMRIDYSERLDLMFELQGSSELALNFDVPLSEGIQKKFPDHELPWNFENYELGSSFFLNYWEVLGTILVILAGIVLLVMLATMTKGKIYKGVFVWLKTIFKWNFLLMIFCSNFDGVVFFTSLEMRTVDFGSFTGVLSFLTCIAANIFAVMVLVKVILILKDIRKLKYLQVHNISAKPQKINPYQKWKNYQVLFLHCKEEKHIQQGFFIIFLVRVYFFHLTIGYIFPNPLAQSIIITILSVFMLTYIITQRPLEEKWDLIKLIMNEVIILIVNLCALALASLAQNGKRTEGNTEVLSYIIIFANVVYNSIALICLSIEAVIALVKIYKEIKAHKLKGMSSLLEIFMIIFAGEAMAMEEEYLSPEAEAGSMTTPDQTPVKRNIQRIELESPQNHNNKNINANSATSELLKIQSPKSAHSLIYDEIPSGIARSRLVRHSIKISDTVFQFEGTPESEKKSSVLENASGVLLSPNGVKGSLAKIDLTNEHLKLLFENSPGGKGKEVNLDD